MRDSKTDKLLPALRPAPPAFVLVGLRNRTLMHRFGAIPLLLRLLHLDLGDLVPAGEKENTTYSATTRNGSRSQRQYAFRLVK